jgi:uncharacterized protein YggU (UPF0235/DUF167 family)
VAAKPFRGRANDGIVTFLAKRLGIPETDLNWLSGKTGRDKTLLVALDPAKTRARLERSK